MQQALEHPDFVPLLRETAPAATGEQLARVHPADYVAAILAIRPEPGRHVQLDPDTVMSAGSAEAALRAAGAAVAAVDAVMEGWADAAFAATRPPGHHAEPARAMGFCLFANAAIAAAHARARWGLARVAVVDFDVHHGNGTQACFENEAALFYGSSHQFPCYPGTGAASERGVAGNIVNAPLRPGAGGREFRAAWEGTILPALAAHRAGAPHHLRRLRRPPRRPAGPAHARHRGFRLDHRPAHGHCGRALRKAGVVSLLEGGYDLAALAASTALHVRRLMRI